jgi:hypothetical protein
MNIENLKNMPIIGEDPEVSAIAQIANAILAAGNDAKDFVEGKVSTMEAQAEKMAQERAETHQSNADAVAEAEKAIGEKYDATKTEYTEDLNKLIAFITDNEDPARTDSIAEALADLQEADAAMDNSFLAFNDEQNKAQEELQTEYGSSLDVSIILFGELLGEKQQRVVE